jgi:hypothetical protein
VILNGLLFVVSVLVIGYLGLLIWQWTENYLEARDEHQWRNRRRPQL